MSDDMFMVSKERWTGSTGSAPAAFPLTLDELGTILLVLSKRVHTQEPPVPMGKFVRYTGLKGPCEGLEYTFRKKTRTWDLGVASGAIPSRRFQVTLLVGWRTHNVTIVLFQFSSRPLRLLVRNMGIAQATGRKQEGPAGEGLKKCTWRCHTLASHLGVQLRTCLSWWWWVFFFCRWMGAGEEGEYQGRPYSITPRQRGLMVNFSVCLRLLHVPSSPCPSCSTVASHGWADVGRVRTHRS